MQHTVGGRSKQSKTEKVKETEGVYIEDYLWILLIWEQGDRKE